MTGEITMKSLFEQNGGTYSVVNGYQIPNLTMPDDRLGNVTQQIDLARDVKSHLENCQLVTFAGWKTAGTFA